MKSFHPNQKFKQVRQEHDFNLQEGGICRIYKALRAKISHLRILRFGDKKIIWSFILFVFLGKIIKFGH